MLIGLTLTDFLISTASREAEELIREHDIIRLSLEDSVLFAQALLAPGAPNEALRRAYERYKRDVASDDE